MMMFKIAKARHFSILTSLLLLWLWLSLVILESDRFQTEIVFFKNTSKILLKILNWPCVWLHSLKIMTNYKTFA